MSPAELPDPEKRQLPCFQNPGPWQDTTNPRTQRWAARKCVTDCHQREWCEQERQATVAVFHIATGVWAGRIWTHSECHVDRAAHPTG